MKKIIAGAIAGIFLMSGAVMASGPVPPTTAVGQWQGSQNQGYDSYNFQGKTFSNTTSYTHATDNSTTFYNQQNCNYDTHAIDHATSSSFTVANTITHGNLQNQGLSMNQIGDQNSEATPAWSVAGGSFCPPGYVAEGNQAGASGNQGQVITAQNEQLNGSFKLDVEANLNKNFAFNASDTHFSGYKADGSYDKSAWGVGGVVAGAAGQLGLFGPSWGVAGLVAGFAGGTEGSFDVASNGYSIDTLKVNGYSNDHLGIHASGSLDYQYQNGGGIAWQNSDTCAGIDCH